MSTTEWNKDKTFLWGQSLLFNEINYENGNELDTLKFIQESHTLKAQFEEIGSSLSLLTQIASCAWGCSKGNHLKENLIRRLVNYCFATIRLTNLGFYNESLSLIRSAGELANLMQLFSHQESEFDEWAFCSTKERWNNYKPEKVRLKLQAFQISEIMDKKTYSQLCSIGIHPSIEYARVSHQENGNVYVGSEFSKETIIMIYNELALLLSPILICVGNFIKVDIEHQNILHGAGKILESLKDSKTSILIYTQQIDKDSLAILSIDPTKKDELIIALSKQTIYLIIVDKPKNLLKTVIEEGMASITLYSIDKDNKSIVPIFSSEKKATNFISSLNSEEQKVCKETKLIIGPVVKSLVESNLTTRLFLNYKTEYEREITPGEIMEINRLVNDH